MRDTDEWTIDTLCSSSLRYLVMGPAMVAFAKRLRRLRGAVTQHELAARARLHRSHVAKIELALREPTVSTIVKLARALHVKPGQFFEDAPGSGRRGKRRRKP